MPASTHVEREDTYRVAGGRSLVTTACACAQGRLQQKTRLLTGWAGKRMCLMYQVLHWCDMTTLRGFDESRIHAWRSTVVVKTTKHDNESHLVLKWQSRVQGAHTTQDKEGAWNVRKHNMYSLRQKNMQADLQGILFLRAVALWLAHNAATKPSLRLCVFRSTRSVDYCLLRTCVSSAWINETSWTTRRRVICYNNLVLGYHGAMHPTSRRSQRCIGRMLHKSCGIRWTGTPMPRQKTLCLLVYTLARWNIFHTRMYPVMYSRWLLNVLDAKGLKWVEWRQCHTHTGK